MSRKVRVTKSNITFTGDYLGLHEMENKTTMFVIDHATGKIVECEFDEVTFISDSEWEWSHT